MLSSPVQEVRHRTQRSPWIFLEGCHESGTFDRPLFPRSEQDEETPERAGLYFYSYSKSRSDANADMNTIETADSRINGRNFYSLSRRSFPSTLSYNLWLLLRKCSFRCGLIVLLVMLLCRTISVLGILRHASPQLSLDKSTFPRNETILLQSLENSKITHFAVVLYYQADTSCKPNYQNAFWNQRVYQWDDFMSQVQRDDDVGAMVRFYVAPCPSKFADAFCYNQHKNEYNQLPSVHWYRQGTLISRKPWDPSYLDSELRLKEVFDIVYRSIPPVPRLTSYDHDDFLKEHKNAFIAYGKFSSMSHEKLLQSWRIFYNLIEEQARTDTDTDTSAASVKIAQVDCTSESDVCQKYNIPSLPTMRWYRDGIATKPDYDGEPNVQSFIAFAQSHS